MPHRAAGSPAAFFCAGPFRVDPSRGGIQNSSTSTALQRDSLSKSKILCYRHSIFFITHGHENIYP
ncbi:MAG: hypothetical protein ACTHKB_11255, partial [Burkholderiaceae bacterium]